jgi:hypothetical protein
MCAVSLSLFAEVAYSVPSNTTTLPYTNAHIAVTHYFCLQLHSTENEEVALPMGERASDAADSDDQKSVLFGDGAKLDAPLTLWTIPGKVSLSLMLFNCLLFHSVRYYFGVNTVTQQ